MTSPFDDARGRLAEAGREAAASAARHGAVLRELRLARRALRAVSPPARDRVEEADVASFPASDPPAWTGATISREARAAAPGPPSDLRR